MIVSKIMNIITEHGFRKVDVNVANISLYYINAGYDTNIVILYDCPTGVEFTKEQYENIQKQVHEKFSKNYHGNIRFLSIVCTDQVNTFRNHINSDSIDPWIIDTKNKTLLIYENQKGDYYGLRNGLETLLFQLKQSDEDSNDVRISNDKTHYYNNRGVQHNNHSGGIMLYLTNINTILIALNVIVFLIVTITGYDQSTEKLLKVGALFWESVVKDHEYYRLFTYMFLHSGYDHLFNNMVILVFLGSYLESAVGKCKYLITYLLSGIIAGLVSMLYNMLNNTPVVSVGASGAIFGVVGAMVYIVVINKGKIENISSKRMILFVILSLYGGLTSQGVDNAAHIGGLIAGFILAAILYKKPRKTYPERGI